MKRVERFVIYSALVVCLAVASRPFLAGDGGSAALALHGGSRAAEFRLATCDVYKITDRLIESERYAEPRDERQRQIEGELEKMATDLQRMQERLQQMSPEDEGAQELFQQYQQLQQILRQTEQEMMRLFQAFVARQYTEAYKQVRAAAEGIAEERGYTHVLASRREESIATDNPQRVVEALLGRPVVMSPEEDDLTEDVLDDLRLH